jgi:3-isopropylmalate/(R)-2-methylmalate dehydratase small subunit
MPDDSAIIRTVSGPGVPVRGNDIDTDRIIPARFMKEVTFDNMGQYAFYDARRNDDGSLNEHPFNRFSEARILVVNQNFGCGSSREHAPQALMRWGIDGLIGESFAEIFMGNCQALGMPTATADPEVVAWLMDRVEARPDASITLDVEQEIATVGDRTLPISIDDSQREALLNGIWDTTALMKSYLDDVKQTADQLPYLNNFESEVQT